MEYKKERVPFYAHVQFTDDKGTGQLLAYSQATFRYKGFTLHLNEPNIAMNIKTHVSERLTGMKIDVPNIEGRPLPEVASKVQKVLDDNWDLFRRAVKENMLPLDNTPIITLL